MGKKLSEYYEEENIIYETENERRSKEKRG